MTEGIFDQKIKALASSISERLGTDPGFRDQLVANPWDALEGAGLGQEVAELQALWSEITTADTSGFGQAIAMNQTVAESFGWMVTVPKDFANFASPRDAIQRQGPSLGPTTLR